jgi:hypothetical protein
MAHIAEAHVVDHRETAEARSVARAEVAVDVVERQARIAQRAPRAFGVQLGGGLVGRVARRVLKGSHHIGLSPDAHMRSRPDVPKRPD